MIKSSGIATNTFHKSKYIHDRDEYTTNDSSIISNEISKTLTNTDKMADNVEKWWRLLTSHLEEAIRLTKESSVREHLQLLLNETRLSQPYEESKGNLRILRDWWNYMTSQLAETLKSEKSRFPIRDKNGIDPNKRMNQWIRDESDNLTKVIHSRIHHLQNPTNCTASRRIVCDISQCGLGCTIHHVSYCLLMGYITNRTLILNSTGWMYNRSGLTAAFLPLSHTCNSVAGGTIIPWIRSTHSSRIVNITFANIQMQHRRPREMIPVVPKEFSQRILHFNNDPFIWWYGQFVQYAFRLQPDIEQYIQSTLSGLDYQHPIVGVHVRGTDKLIWEAKPTAMDDYMNKVKAYYDWLNLTTHVPVRRVFVATDDSMLIPHLMVEYPEYKFVVNTNAIKSAKLSRRGYGLPGGLQDAILDAVLLVQSDHVVCTFSSNYCRLIYELKQAELGDASATVHSTDRDYYVHGITIGGESSFRFWKKHVSIKTRDITLNVDNIVKQPIEFRNGLSTASFTDNHRFVTYPTYKTIASVWSLDFVHAHYGHL